MTTDWIRLYRKALESKVFSDPFLWQLFCWCLLNANWKEGYFEGKIIPRGSFVTGRLAASKALNVTESKFRRGIKRLESFGNISSKPTNRFTVIRIEKYEVFQSPNGRGDQPVANQRPTSGHNRRREEVKKERKGGKPRLPSLVSPTVEQIQIYADQYQRDQAASGKVWPIRKFDPAAFFDHYAANGWKQSNGNLIKDWQATVRSWGRRSFGDTPAEKSAEPVYPKFTTPPRKVTQ